MDRSIRKSISVHGFERILELNSISRGDASRLICDLFENPTAERDYHLKDEIRTRRELEDRIHSVTDNKDFTTAMINIFYVTDDLYIPSELNKAFSSNVEIALFVGAGVSNLLKVPLWDELAERAINYMRDNSYINFAEAEKLKSGRMPAKQVLTIFRQIVRNEEEWENFYKNNLAGEDSPNDPYELLSELEESLPKPVIKITTNIDLAWQTVLKNRAQRKKGEISEDGTPMHHRTFYEETRYTGFSKAQRVSGDKLYQIHGNLEHLDSAIITTSQYVKHYRDEDGLKGFLEGIFDHYTVVFIGSSMQEFEILEHCLKRGNNPYNKHFALVATYMDEGNLFRIKKNYFSALNIEAIPYFLDFQGYDRLYLVLQKWVDQIKSSNSPHFYRDAATIDEVLS